MALGPCCWPFGSTPALPVFKRGGLHEAQASECRLGWAPRAFRVWVPCSGRLLLQAGWQEEEELMWGKGGRKKRSNAMSHSALAAGEGDREGGLDEGRGQMERILLHVV